MEQNNKIKNNNQEELKEKEENKEQKKDLKGKEESKKQDRRNFKGKPPFPYMKNLSNKKPSFWNNLSTALLIFLSLLLIYSLFFEDKEEIEQISLSRLASDISSGEVERVTVRGQDVEIIYNDGVEKETMVENWASITDTLVNYGLTSEEMRAVEIESKRQEGFSYWMMTLGPFLLPLFLILLILWFLLRQAKGAGMQAFTFGQSKARMISPHDKSQRVTFEDVAGAKEAKEELLEIVDFLKNPKKFINMGAQIPKGILLMGAPGTGKTLLARAVAGEARVSFFSISGSEFVEMFVGVGASRTRDLFKMAKQASPAIIFIDEVDAIGRVRGSGVGGGNDEREQTLNQILVEMDGFEPNEKIIIMAATNRPDVLDPALLRPGRFDRRVTIDLPDRKDREAILKVQARKKPLAEDVDFRVISERTPGFSGADIYSLVNEAAILAAREDRKTITQFDMVRSIEKVLLGPERKSHVLSEHEKNITAYHEAGHAITASVLPYADPVHKISIISRGRAAGYTLKLPSEDRRLHSKKEFLDDIAVSFGGYVTELMIFNDLTTGASNDLQVATALARNMVTRYGMSEKIGPVAMEESGGLTMQEREYYKSEHSEETLSLIDEEVSRIINEQRDRVEKILKDHSEALESVASKLMEVETLERAEYEAIIKEHGIDLEKKSSQQLSEEQRKLFNEDSQTVS
jgi:cell division protease FtsH